MGNRNAKGPKPAKAPKPVKVKKGKKGEQVLVQNDNAYAYGQQQYVLQPQPQHHQQVYVQQAQPQPHFIAPQRQQAFGPPQPQFLPAQQPMFGPAPPAQPMFGPPQPHIHRHHHHKQHHHHHHQQVGGLAPNEVQNLEQSFRAAAGIDQKLDLNEFIALYSQMHPQTQGSQFQQLAANAFVAMDTNRSGRINLNEFLEAYSRLRQQARVL
jgi:hypothetical protein